MIDLGRLRIETEASIVDARNKIRVLGEALGFDPVTVTRIAIVVSDLCRMALRKREMFHLKIGLDVRGQRYGLALIFKDCDDSGLLAVADRFFDKVQNIHATDGSVRFLAFRWIDQPGFIPTEELIARERDRISQLSKADQLLRVILPDSIAEELTAKDSVESRRHEDVAVLFADIVGFTAFCEGREPDEVVNHLQEFSLAFESIAERHQVEKIKTIGDCFMAAAGLLNPLGNPVLHCIHCGLEMLEAVHELASGWNLRVGIHVGPVIAGIVGHKRFSYDLWGDTVNTASRVESNGKAGAVNLSYEAWKSVSDELEAESIGHVPAKGKGEMEIFCVQRLVSVVR
jgi:class 3 adenylate cyclase